MRKLIANVPQMLAVARVSNTTMPVRVSTDQIPSEQIIVFATTSFADQAVLSSNIHHIWVMKHASTIGVGAGTRYTPTDVFDTFPRPAASDDLAELGEALDVRRREVMLRRKLGLTSLYNLVNNPDLTQDPDINRIRELHVDIDDAVMAAYGWNDVSLGHGFHLYRQFKRFTVSASARVEITDRLLEENHRRGGVGSEDVAEAQEDLFS